MERISITARLNGMTLQFEEAAYARLESYLAEAAQALEGNPDRDEILADLEQAVAERCRTRLPEQPGPVTLAHLQPVLEDVGSVEEPEAQSVPPEQPRRERPRRLEQVSQGAIISGVCQGFARYFDIDVTLVRLVVVLLFFVSGGAMILIYGILMLVLPYAPEQPSGASIWKVPAKSREFVEFLRSKLGAVPN